jgi:hypothetical protein
MRMNAKRSAPGKLEAQTGIDSFSSRPEVCGLKYTNERHL